jgi:hypothetical protein
VKLHHFVVDESVGFEAYLPEPSKIFFCALTKLAIFVLIQDTKIRNQGIIFIY